MNLILVLLLAAVAWYLLSGLGTRQRVGGNQGDGGNRDFRVNTARSTTDAMDTTMKSTASSTTNQGSSLVQPEDAQEKGGKPSVSDNGTFQSSNGQNQQTNSQGNGQNNQLQSGSYQYGEDSGTLASMQDQAGVDNVIKDWQTESLTNLDNGGLGMNGGQMANGEQTGLTQEIGNLYNNSLYDGGLGSYEGTDLGANTDSGAGLGNQFTNASGGTQEVNAYQPQLTGFSDATTTDEYGNKVTSIQDKRQKKNNNGKNQS